LIVFLLSDYKRTTASEKGCTLYQIIELQISRIKSY